MKGWKDERINRGEKIVEERFGSYKIKVIIFVLMKGTRKQYEVIHQLPADALSIANYAKHKGITVSYVYKLFNEGKSLYKIVDFQGYNFIVFN